MRFSCNLQIILISTCLLVVALLSQAEAVQLGNMPANKILFLGNSITFCPQPNSEDWWGLTASDPEHDYAHLLTQKINAATGGSLSIVVPNPPQGTPPEGGTGETRWEPGDPLPNYTGNIINICDIFEQSFDTWENARIQNQLDGQPDIVVIQFGENMIWQNRTLEQFRTAFRTMLTGLKNSSNPHIFVTSHILGPYPAEDEVKRQLCAEDPTHRVFVDLGVLYQNPSVNFESTYGHPSDQGMAVIADTIFSAMETHSVPEPGSVTLLTIGTLTGLAYALRKRKSAKK